MLSARTGASAVGAGGAGSAHGKLAMSGMAGRAAPDVAPNPDIGVLALADASPGGARPWQRDDALAPLTSLLGARVAAANPVWGPHALALLRSLQKKLIGHALTLDGAARRPLLDAVAVVEQAVTMRVRMLQMQFSELEPGQSEPATTPARKVGMASMFEQPSALLPYQGNASEPEEDAALGLAWGLLATRQFHATTTLVQGSLAVWPHQPLLHLLGAYAAVELGQALAPAVQALLRQPVYGGLAPLIARRAVAAHLSTPATPVTARSRAA